MGVRTIQTLTSPNNNFGRFKPTYHSLTVNAADAPVGVSRPTGLTVGIDGNGHRH